jgi:hypothetical protein
MEKKQLQNVLTTIGFLVVIALVTVGTQVQGQSLAYGIRANIPFDFSVADKKLPSGKYSIGRTRQSSDDSVLAITDGDGRSKAIRLSISVQTLSPKEHSTFVFHRYGDQYFLFQVWIAGEATGREFVKSRSEREIQSNLAANSSMKKMAENAGAVETVTIVAALQ